MKIFNVQNFYFLFTNILHEVIPEVVGGDHQTPEVDKRGRRHHRERDPRDVDDLETPQGQEADLSDLVKNMLTFKITST